MKANKYNLYSDEGKLEITKKLINYELKPFGKKYEDVLNWKKKIPWYETYKFENEEEHDKWKNKCIKFLRTKVRSKMTIKNAEKEMSWFSLMYGLAVKKNKK